MSQITDDAVVTLECQGTIPGPKKFLDGLTETGSVNPTTPVTFSPASMKLGAVRPGTTGPDISVDPSFGPPAISFNGGVEIKTVPANAQVTAHVVGDPFHFGVRDIILMEWTLEEVDPGELPPGHKGPPPKVKVLEVVGQSDGTTPLAVTAGQYVLVRAQYTTSFFDAGTLSATLVIEGDTWAPIEVPLTLFLAQISTIFTSPPLVIVPGQSASTPILIQSLAGPSINVSYTNSRTQLHSGLSVAPNSFQLNPGDSINQQLTFQADPDAPLGENTLALDQWDFMRMGLLLPVNIVPAPLPSGPGFDDSIQWSQAGGSALAINKDQGIWYSGHINAILPLGGGGLLVGSDSGGVWSVAPNGVALPLSNDWDNPEITCMTVGPDGPNHFYAGAGSGAVYVSEPDSAFLNFIRWNPVPLLDSNGNPLDTGAVYCMVATKGNRKLVLACGNGVFWSDIPPLGQRHTFTKVPILPDMGYSGLALGPNDTVVAASLGDKNTVQSGMFVGDWPAGQLQFQRANINGSFDVLQMRRTSVSSCDGQPSNMMAVASAADEMILQVLRSQDGGQNWQVLSTNVKGKNIPLNQRPADANPAGLQGSYNNCIMVAPMNPNLVALGWRNGPWFSQDMGINWDLPKNNRDDNHLHEDLHALAFEPSDPSGQTLYFGCDGGVMVTRDLGLNVTDEYNQRLQTFQFEGNGREFYGVFSPSRRVPGLIAGGLQDNGNVYAALDSGSNEFRQLEGSDGHVTLFIETGHVLHYNSNEVDKVTVHRWDGSQFVDGSVVPVYTSGPGSTDVSSGLPRAVIEAVSLPLFRSTNSGQLMYAMACAFGSSDVYGLFSNEDGGSMHWDYIGTIPTSMDNGQVWALASLHGDNVFAGTQDGRIFALSPRSKQPFELGVPIRDTKPGEIWRICVLRDGVAYASYCSQNNEGFLLQSNFFSWDPLGNNDNVARGIDFPAGEGPIYGFDIDRGANPHTLFAATDNHVFVSRDEGDTWKLATKGLPRRSHCTELRAVAHDNGQRFLYLSTFGRSAWRASLT